MQSITITLREALSSIELDQPSSIPWIVRILENPSSVLSLPGRVELFDHDCLHAILCQETNASGEAFVVGFCMGNDPNTNFFHLLIFKICSRFLYPRAYKISSFEHISFQAGFNYGKSLPSRIYRQEYSRYLDLPTSCLQYQMGIKHYELQAIEQEIKIQQVTKKRLLSWSDLLKYSSTIFAILGGFLLALNLEISGYGFVLLGCSSFQLLISSLLQRDKSLIIYAGSLFCFVDLLGIYRWVLKF